ncbi:sugar-binding transcriptional regulator [Thalassotalea sp. ND16A]|uniref:sugar-binding transcriptional regulator n=1 Tax=Thalassotalea sp. ND16A TaxID=1535422 RepID=UPI00051A76DB|nr:sugar-binding domain-containing protein [Thalassotalea sp. ND16A]KGJ98437.1 hypothetical protein ND16A_0746 [Thalassotalea sp. ND16A]
MSQNTTIGLRSAWYIYGANIKQNETADLLGLSRSKVNRLLSYAKETEQISYTIDGNPNTLLNLERKLCQMFSLNSCIVCETDLAPSSYHTLGGDPLMEAGAHKLQSMISHLSKPEIGLGKSRTISAVAEHLQLPYSQYYAWIALHGCLSANLETNPFEIIEDICKKAGGEGYLVPVPAIARTRSEANSALKRQGTSSIMSLATNASMYAFSIGTINDTEHMKNILGLNEQEIANLKTQGAVGDILGHFINENGKPVTGKNVPIALALDLSSLKQKSSLVIAGGKAKSMAIRAALRGGYISDLVIDSDTAAAIITES